MTMPLKNWLIVFFLFISVTLFPVETFAKVDGEFILKFSMPKEKVLHDIAVVFKASHQFQNIVAGMNREFILPANIVVEFADKDGPVYDPTTKTITMSYDFIYYLSQLYLQRYPKASDEDMVYFALRSNEFLLYHEMAHALIDLYELPMVSNEETAADNLAVIIALEDHEDGYDIVMDSAELFDIFDHTTKKYQEADMWDEHALDAQRFYNIVCLTYGKYPKKVLKELTELKNKKLLNFINKKGEYCKVQYEQQLQAWLKLLDPYFKQTEESKPSNVGKRSIEDSLMQSR